MTRKVRDNLFKYLLINHPFSFLIDAGFEMHMHLQPKQIFKYGRQVGKNINWPKIN